MITLETLPPSANHAYKHVTLRSKSGKTYTGRRLTDEAQAWRDGAALAIKNAIQHQDWTPTAPLRIDAWLFHPRMLGSDTDGRTKLLMDAIKDATGIDDRYYLDHHICKRRGPERLVLTIFTLDPDLIALPKRARKRVQV